MKTPAFPYFRLAALAPVAGAFLLALAGCSGSAATATGDATPCPDIRIRQGFADIARSGINTGQPMRIHVKGVAAYCKPGESADTIRMEVLMTLQVTRLEGDSRKPETAPFDATFAFVDSGGAVAGRHVFSDDADIGRARQTTDKVARIFMDIPQGTRVVFGLGKSPGA